MSEFGHKLSRRNAGEPGGPLRRDDLLGHGVAQKPLQARGLLVSTVLNRLGDLPPFFFYRLAERPRLPSSYEPERTGPVDDGLERDAVAFLELLELPERDFPARRHQGLLERVPRQEERARELVTEALRALLLREAAEDVPELVGGRKPHPVVRVIAVDRDQRDCPIAARQAFEPHDAAQFENPDPLLLQEAEKVRHRTRPKSPGPAHIEGGGLDIGGGPDRAAGQRVHERLRHPEAGLDLEATPDIILHPEPQGDCGLRRELFPLSEADLVKGGRDPGRRGDRGVHRRALTITPPRRQPGHVARRSEVMGCFARELVQVLVYSRNPSRVMRDRITVRIFCFSDERTAQVDRRLALRPEVQGIAYPIKNHGRRAHPPFSYLLSACLVTTRPVLSARSSRLSPAIFRAVRSLEPKCAKPGFVIFSPDG